MDRKQAKEQEDNLQEVREAGVGGKDQEEQFCLS